MIYKFFLKYFHNLAHAYAYTRKQNTQIKQDVRKAIIYFKKKTNTFLMCVDYKKMNGKMKINIFAI